MATRLAGLGLALLGLIVIPFIWYAAGETGKYNVYISFAAPCIIPVGLGMALTGVKFGEGVRHQWLLIPFLLVGLFLGGLHIYVLHTGDTKGAGRLIRNMVSMLPLAEKDLTPEQRAALQKETEDIRIEYMELRAKKDRSEEEDAEMERLGDQIDANITRLQAVTETVEEEEESSASDPQTEERLRSALCGRWDYAYSVTTSRGNQYSVQGEAEYRPDGTYTLSVVKKTQKGCLFTCTFEGVWQVKGRKMHLKDTRLSTPKFFQLDENVWEIVSVNENEFEYLDEAGNRLIKHRPGHIPVMEEASNTP